MTTRLLVQTHKETASLLEALKVCLAMPDLQGVRVASAYARWDGIGLVSTDLESLISRGGSFEFIYGAGNGVTTPDSLLYGLYLKELFPDQILAMFVEDKYSNSIFHPKIFDFLFPKYHLVIIGSGNFTGGGLLRNTEIAVQVRMPKGGELEKELNASWKKLKKLAEPVTPKRVRELVLGEKVGSEKDQHEGIPRTSRKPALKVGHRVAQKPLFQKVVDLKSSSKKSKILSKLDSLTEKPDKLYLQIFPNETGGNANSAGYQVQLPVATLAAYFGVGVAETKQAEFRFPNEIIVTNLTHFINNTHRVRLRPILDIPRPAILIFERIEDGIYKVRSERPGRYAKTLAEKCTQQSRVGSRRWGFA